MTSIAVPRTNAPLTPGRALLLGTLTVGVLDGLDAVVFYGTMGVAPIRIFQSIASGLLGREAFAGGLQTALLGALLHFFIAFAVVATYLAASRRIAALTRHAVLCGLLYGVAVYTVMNFVVLPLSAAGAGARTVPIVVNGLLIHMLGVGLPAALFARAARPAG
ncbi:MAG TPA: hypothetical protein VHG91_06980 [Longimicrobium sp.]|nr:hypothetical protein [Longimicrobium sp.]